MKAAPPMLLPNFLGIGAQRSATTWAHSCLAEHPEAFVPQEKELSFYTKKFDRGMDWYASQFEPGRDRKAIGEITPTYLTNHQAVERIAETLPEVRLFVIFRNPIDRAFSAYQLLKPRFGWTSFRDAYTRSEYLISLGMYGRHLQNLLQYFPHDRVKVLWYDDVQAKPGRVLAELFGFLGIDETFRPKSQGERLNRVVLPGAQQKLRRLGLGWGIDLVKRTPIAGLVKELARPAGATRRDIRHLRDVYHDDILKLQELTGRELSQWLAADAVAQ